MPGWTCSGMGWTCTGAAAAVTTVLRALPKAVRKTSLWSALLPFCVAGPAGARAGDAGAVSPQGAMRKTNGTDVALATASGGGGKPGTVAAGVPTSLC